MESVTRSGEIEIRGRCWEWRIVEGALRSRRAPSPTSSWHAVVSFRDPDDPGRELWGVLPEDEAEDLTEQKLRELFGRSWAVSL